MKDICKSMECTTKDHFLNTIARTALCTIVYYDDRLNDNTSGQ